MFAIIDEPSYFSSQVFPLDDAIDEPVFEEELARLEAIGQFDGRPKVELGMIYEFGDLEFVVRSDLPEILVAVVTHGILESLSMPPSAAPV